MSVTLTVSDKIYRNLENAARRRELESVEQYLEKVSEEEIKTIQTAEFQDAAAERREAVDEILNFHEKMKAKYGVMPDSTEILREDRMRG